MLATATLLRQHFAKHDAAQMTNDLIVKETLGTRALLATGEGGLVSLADALTAALFSLRRPGYLRPGAVGGAHRKREGRNGRAGDSHNGRLCTQGEPPSGAGRRVARGGGELITGGGSGTANSFPWI